MAPQVGRERRIDLLRGVWLLSGCTHKELAKIAELATVVDVDSGRVLAQEGHPGKEFFVVVSGEAVVTIRDEVIGAVESGTFFGEMALLDGGPRVATVTSATSMVLLVLTVAEFRQVLDAAPSVARQMLMVLGSRLRSVDAPESAGFARADGLPTGV